MNDNNSDKHNNDKTAGAHAEPLSELAVRNQQRVDDQPEVDPVRGDRGDHLDVQAIREIMYSLHAVSIGTHQLLYFAAMKYAKNHLDADAATVPDAVQELATVFDTMNIGTLRLTEQEPESDAAVLELAENALTFDAETKKPICYFISGYIAGYLENALDDHFVVNEVACISQGSDACMFRAQKR